jgi:pepF/M3 family oligoendopeptidase
MKASSSESLPHWDLSDVYPGLESDEFRRDLDWLKSQLDDLDSYLSDQEISRTGVKLQDPSRLAQVISGYLTKRNEMLRLYRTLLSYIYSFVATDSYNTTAKRAMSELDVLRVRLERQEVLFQGWLGMLAEGDSEALSGALAQEGPVGEHAFYLQEAVEQSRFQMSEAEETLASELSMSGASAWQRLHGVITSQVKVPFERDGRVEEIPVTVVQNLCSDPDSDIRRRAYEAELGAWERVREPLAACMNGVKGAVITLYQRRGRTDALHQALDQARIDRETLETMLGAMRDAFPMFRRYWYAKAQSLGRERLPWWDLWAPVGRLERRYTFAEARDFILEQFGKYSQRLAGFAQRAFDGNWIDAEPRDGKRGGAFCIPVPAVEESRILCNFDGSLSQVTTLAHELGHAYHNACMVGKTLLQRRTPMTLAETASIFCQTIIVDATLGQAAEDEEELAILEDFLIDASQVIVDIYSRYLFETEVFERRVEAELSADDFCDIMRRCQQETYGDGLDSRYLHPYMWAWKPHYYSPSLSYYNFPYAFGLLFGLGLYAIYQQRGAAFLPEYDALLSSTGEATAADLAARFDIDLRQPAFWEGSLSVIETRVERYLEL